MKGQWQNSAAVLVLPLAFLPRLVHTKSITRREAFIMNPEQLTELREKHIKNPPEGMTAELVRGMTDSDLLDMHYFMTEDDDFDGEFEEGFYIF